MKTLILNIISFVAQEQLKRIEESQKQTGISGSSVWVSPCVAQSLANADKQYFKTVMNNFKQV